MEEQILNAKGFLIGSVYKTKGGLCVHCYDVRYFS